MKYVFVAIAALFLATACTPTERGAVAGGAIGAAVGGAASGTVQGAAVGGAVGAVAGALIGRASEPGRCIYRDRYGRQYVAACP
ncbi:MAG: glycine zipper domain-containing protein [Flavobacteriaceae bacterium]